MMKRNIVYLILVVSFLMLQPTQFVKAAAISLDGSFGDWGGQPCVSDPQSDAGSSGDLLNFCFVSDQSAQQLFFLVERLDGGNSPMKFSVRLDMNDDGDYSDGEDRSIYVVYNPSNKKTKVDVTIYNGSGGYINTVASGADWGASGSEGASKVEFYASYSDLGLTPGVAAALTMDVVTYQGNNPDDYLNTPVQWTPANALGYGLLAVIMVAAVIIFSRRQKKTVTEYEG